MADGRRAPPLSPLTVPAAIVETLLDERSCLKLFGDCPREAEQREPVWSVRGTTGGGGKSFVGWGARRALVFLTQVSDSFCVSGRPIRGVKAASGGEFRILFVVEQLVGGCGARPSDTRLTRSKSKTARRLATARGAGDGFPVLDLYTPPETGVSES